MSVFPGIDEIAPAYMDEAFDKNIPQERIYGQSEPDPENIKHHDVNALATGWLAEFNNALADVKADPAGLDKFLLPHTIWKDHLSLQLDLRDFIGPDKIKDQLVKSVDKIGHFELDKQADYRYPTGVALQTIHPEGPHGEAPIEWIFLYLKYATDYGIGRGSIKLISVKDEAAPIGLKALSIYTVLDEFTKVPERAGKKRPLGANHGENVARKTWLEKRQEEQDYKGEHQPLCVIVGGGQGGLTIAARMKAFGYNTLVVESNNRIGDNWRKRYKFLSLHDPFYYHKLPYIHSDMSPMYSSKDQFAEFLECYAKMLELNVWTNTTVTGAEFDESKCEWEVTVKNNSTSDVKKLHPKHVVFCTGHSGEPNVPKFPDEDKFQGEIVHSSKHTSGANYEGKRALVIGACNSAHDIAQDFYEQGIKEVTMLQRSSTCVISSHFGVKINCRDVFDENGPDIDTADLLLHNNPIYLTNLLMQQQYRESSKADASMLEGLKKAGFQTNAGMGGTGLFGLYYRRGSGYYIDVGCSKLIIDGKVKVKHSTVKRFTETGVELNDGSVIDNLDIVVKATGYSNMKDTARDVFGHKVSDKLNPVWNLDEEGEFRSIWRPSGHPNFWFMGGNLAMARYYSKRLALQIIGQEEGF
ncbi:FMO4 [Cyberlindnera jadinii]|uniref:FMO4 protein n=1 Tax=Cyberlindnera jadinii (strain ATCC 18201 / CBS 1600 / BCRC 20928 / JCM 3617 / NBRC 0987 / NRRL Y-1542) TaxID=983966 RepID=A0A0H5CEM5_CYBJN|nr:FMO4 [Cyberlindnera jadinii]